MSDVLIPAADLDFLLWHWLAIGDGEDAPDRGEVDAVLDLARRVAAETFLPHYKQADRIEPHQDEAGEVHVLPEIGVALRTYAELGLFGAGFSPELGGLGLPSVVTTALLSQFMAANVATAGYPMLTMGNARLIAAFGTPAQVETFARPQIEGRWFGTMCLSEPQAGSGLADVRTRATPDGEDALGRRYRLAGNKMWISGGDQDISETIVHLVLAKVAGGDGALPPGTAGISLFIVPKHLPGGARNDVAVAGLNHKMGYRGTANCLLNLGEGRFTPEGAAGALGWLVGAEGQGLALMFKMMNEARINVGLGAAALGYRGYRHALGYARERLQGRALDAPRGATAIVPIIEHPDVQRMLLAQKCYAEGALALILYCARLVDREHADEDAAELLALLTPVAKTWPSEWGLAANDLAIQVHGGYGYTRDFDVEQLYRDNRLNPIHEGTTGIQALDLLGRKILRSNGRALALLGDAIADTAARSGPAFAAHGDALAARWRLLEQTVAAMRGGDPIAALANATPFLSGFGHLVLAWLWLDQAIAAQAAPVDPAFAAGKARACRFFYECELPKVDGWFGFAGSGSDVARGVPLDQF